MKLLFDQNLSFRLCEMLSDLFPGSSQTKLEGLESASDLEIWRFALQHDFTLASKDSDFSEMAALNGPPPKVIWLRCGNQPTLAVSAKLRSFAQILIEFGDDESACLEIY